MDPCMFFSGSSDFKYQPSQQLEAGNSTKLHSITAMRVYENLSNEEIRMADYKASGGLFGSPFAKLIGTFCVQPDEKLRPYCYGHFFFAAIRQHLSKLQDDQFICPPKFNDDAFNMERRFQRPRNLNLTFQGKEKIKVLVKCSGDLNVNFKSVDPDNISKFVSYKDKSHKKSEIQKRRKH